MTVRWGLAGTGNLAGNLVEEYQLAEGAELVAVGSRTLERAQEFASQHQIARAHGSYLDLVSDPDVDAIHIVTPHPQHLSVALAAIEQGKAVLVEKSFTATHAGAQRLIEAARDRGVFCMEALWTRFLPSTRELHRLLDEAAIGEVRSLQGDLFAYRDYDPSDRLFDPVLGGGAMLDLGVYALTFALDVFGPGAEVIGATGSLFESGSDADGAWLLRWPDGRVASQMISLRSYGPGRMVIHGSKGSIEVPPRFHHSPKLLVRIAGEPPREIDLPWQGRGYSYEISAVSAAISQGLTEHELMPLEHTLEVQRLMADLLDRLDVHPRDDQPPGGTVPDVDIHRDDAQQRYVVEVDGKRAGGIDFRVAGDGLVALPHTLIGEAYRGQGLAEQVVEFALNDIRERDLRVVADPLCPYIAKYFDEHPEYADLRHSDAGA